MRKIAILVGLCCIGVGLYFSFIRKPEVGRRVRILPGIEFVFTRNENAADYYAKAYRSMSRRAADDRDLKSLTPDEGRWFMLGTSCRDSSWYPEHSPHITDPMGAFPQLKYLRGLGRIMAEEGRSVEREGDAEKAMDIWKRVAVLGWHTDREQETMLQVLVGIAIEAIAYDEFIRHHREHGNTQETQRYEGFKQRLRRRSKELTSSLNIATAIDFHRVKKTAVSHRFAFVRKDACGVLTYYCATKDPSVRQDVVVTLTEISREDADPLVRKTAANWLPYAQGKKSLPGAIPQETRE